jgi:ABC-type sugar transport system permease subunit
MMFLSLTGIFGAGGAALLLTGGAYGTYDFGYWQYTRVTGGGENAFNTSAALGWMITAISLPISLFFKRLADRVEPAEF